MGPLAVFPPKHPSFQIKNFSLMVYFLWAEGPPPQTKHRQNLFWGGGKQSFFKKV